MAFNGNGFSFGAAEPDMQRPGISDMLGRMQQGGMSQMPGATLGSIRDMISASGQSGMGFRDPRTGGQQASWSPMPIGGGGFMPQPMPYNPGNSSRDAGFGGGGPGGSTGNPWSGGQAHDLVERWDKLSNPGFGGGEAPLQQWGGRSIPIQGGSWQGDGQGGGFGTIGGFGGGQARTQPYPMPGGPGMGAGGPNPGMGGAPGGNMFDPNQKYGQPRGFMPPIDGTMKGGGGFRQQPYPTPQPIGGGNTLGNIMQRGVPSRTQGITSWS
jgi:hypothetical protein